MDLSIIGYDPAGAWIKTADTADELLRYRNPAGITWINVNDPKNTGEISRIADFFHIHPLTVEDIMDTGQRPKIEEFDNYLFIILKALNSGDPPVTEQISLVLMEDTVITFQEIPGDSFDGIRKRILNNAGRIRRMGADYLAYALMDSVVDAYFLVLDALGAGIEDFEERAIDENDTALIPDLQRAKQNLIRVRRVIWPLRESLSVLLRLDSKLINDVLKPFLKDLHDNIIQAVETVENYRELMAGVMEVNLSSVSNRMNGVMKVLTIISTIFIPLTFIVGVYGMNFVFMPELNYPYAYPITWAVMVLIAAGMLFYFKRRRWI
ncbi:MAG: magnesium/cobalt transporter CorA [Treponema sp.]|jgi:magnesium transporter|nr:magnesium/cobalt transporter CorA [Treponema sp.]